MHNQSRVTSPSGYTGSQRPRAYSRAKSDICAIRSLAGKGWHGNCHLLFLAPSTASSLEHTRQRLSCPRLPQALVQTRCVSRSLSAPLSHVSVFHWREHSSLQHQSYGNTSREQMSLFTKGLLASWGDLDVLRGEAGPHWTRRLQPAPAPRVWLMQLFPCEAAFFKALILIKKKERIWSSYFDLVPRIIWKFFFLERDFLFQISPWWGERVSWAELG